MGKTNRDKKKFEIPKTLNPQAFIKDAEDARNSSKPKLKTKRPQDSKKKSIRKEW